MPHNLLGKPINSGRTRFKKGCVPWNKGKRNPYMIGNKLHAGTSHWQWKGGISKDPLYNKLCLFRRRHTGIDPLSIDIIQSVYEDNIKKYGRLTCYLCKNKIVFGNDCLEHKVPISRGGDNKKDNLEIACRKCNSKKHTKTTKEYLRSINDCK